MYLYTSDSPDAPKLTNTYGDFNAILNYIIDGGNLIDVVKIEPRTDKTVKIYYDEAQTSCPWARYQTITIVNSDNYEMDFFIENIDLTDKYVIGYNSTIVFANSEIEQSTDINFIKAKTKASGITRIFGGTTAQRTVFKFRNSIQFRLDDRYWGALMTTPVALNNSWAKTARICMSESFETLDYTAYRLWPYNDVRPNENFVPSGNYIGQSHIFYNSTGADTKYITDTTNTGSGSAYKIWANNDCMYIQIFASTLTTATNSRFYMIGDFNCLYKDKPNGIIQSSRLGGENVYSGTSTYMRPSAVNEAPAILNTTSKSYSHITIFNNSQDEIADCYMYGGFGFGSTAPSGSGGLAVPNIINNGVYLSDVHLITTTNDFVGTLYGIKWINSTIPNITQGTVTIYDNEAYMFISSHGAIGLIKLDRA